MQCSEGADLGADGFGVGQARVQLCGVLRMPMCTVKKCMLS